MTRPECPTCGSFDLLVERRPHGDASCQDCPWQGPYEDCFIDSPNLVAPDEPRRWSSSHPGLTREMVDVVDAIHYDNAIKEIENLKAKLQLISEVWKEHQHTKFKSDGSHFQVDIKMNELVHEIEKIK